MKRSTKQNILQKTIIVILTVLCINFIVPTYSNASGGVLMNPFLEFVATLGDIVESLLQWCMTGQAEMGVSLADSDIMVDAGSDKITNEGGDNPTLSVNSSDLDLKSSTSGNTYQVPVVKYTPEEIFSNKVAYLDIDFINPKWTKNTTEYGNNGTAAILQETIASWYVALRNFSVVGLLCVLVYVGIRILLSSTAPDKAKYKQMFTDWLIALCILFFLHYIMSFTLVMIDSINDAIAGEGYTADSVVISVDGTTYTTNLMGAARFMVQSKDTLERFAYCIIYWALIAYTVIFTWHYLKRVLMMAFLTIIAPLVSLTYPIDKIGDGKAQAFNMWLKEYVYNALIQPFHLIIYMVFVGSAIDLAKVNPIYSIAAIGFILPAEKFLKKMFGFDKAPLGTMGALTGFTLGSLASSLGKGKSSGGIKGASNESENSANKPPRYERHHGTDGIDYAENHNLGASQTQQDTPKLQSNNLKDDIDNKEKPNLLSGNLNEEERAELQKLGEELDNTDYNDMYLNPGLYAEKQARYDELQKREAMQDQQKEIEEQSNNLKMQETELTEELDNSSSESSNQEESKENNQRRFDRILKGGNNIVSAHGGAKQIALKGAKKLGRAVKFTARTGFTAAGAIAGAGMGLASGQGLAGFVAGAKAGKELGKSVGRKLTDLPENIYGKGKDIYGSVRESGRRTIDTFNGNTQLEDKARAKAFMKDANTEQYIRDKWTKEHDGMAPTDKEVREEKDKIQDYADEGMTDIAAIYRAQKAEKFGVSAKQSAKIALLAQDRKITSKELGDEKEYNRRKQDFTQEFINKGQSQESAAKNADYILNVMKAQVGQAHNLNKPSNNQSASSQTNTTKSATNKGNTTSKTNKSNSSKKS